MRLAFAMALALGFPAVTAAQMPSPSSTPIASTPTPTPTPSPNPEDAKLLEEIEAASNSRTQPTLTPSAAGGTASNLFNPAISLSALFAAAAYSETEAPEPGAHDPQGTGLTLQNLELTASANVDPYMRADANIIFTLEGVEVEEAYLTTLALPGRFQVKAGQIFTPFGRHNRIHPHAWQFVDQNLVNVLMFGGDGLRNPSVSLSWLAPLPVYTEFLGSVLDPRGETAVSFFGEEEEGVEGRPIDSGDDLVYLGKASLSFPLGESITVLAGASGLTGPNPSTGTARTVIGGGDLYIKWRPPTSIYRFAFFQAEAMAREYEIADGTQRDEGFYAFAGARVARRLEVAIRGESVRSDVTLDPEAIPWRNRFSGNLTFRPSEFSKLRLQGNYDVVAGADDPILGAVLQWETIIGAHGAHAF